MLPLLVRKFPALPEGSICAGNTVRVLLLPLIVLLVRVSVVARATSVSVAVGNVTVPVFVKLDAVAPVSVFVEPIVLLVSVSAVARATIVSVVSGNVSTRVLVVAVEARVVVVLSDAPL